MCASRVHVFQAAPVSAELPVLRRFMVLNGACKHGDLAHFKEQLAIFGGDVSIEHRDDLQLLALQGDGAAAALGKIASQDVSKLHFMEGRPMEVNGVDCYVTRCGYTGEDGYEVRQFVVHVAGF